MSKRNRHLNLGASPRAYLTAIALIASAALFVAIAYQVLTTAKQSTEEAFFPLAAMAFGLIWILTERVLKRTVFGVTLTTAWQDRLTFAIPMEFVLSSYMIRDLSDTWAVTSQLIGGWVIFGCAAILVDLLWSGIKAGFVRSDSKPDF